MFRPAKNFFRYTLNLVQWASVIKVEDEQSRGYEAYKGYVNSAPVERNPKLFYTKEEFNTELALYRELLKSDQSPIKLKI